MAARSQAAVRKSASIQLQREAEAYQQIIMKIEERHRIAVAQAAQQAIVRSEEVLVFQKADANAEIEQLRDEVPLPHLPHGLLHDLPSPSELPP